MRDKDNRYNSVNLVIVYRVLFFLFFFSFMYVHLCDCANLEYLRENHVPVCGVIWSTTKAERTRIGIVYQASAVEIR